jgi:phenylpropionate dioxygenase-like ring-hydroxylating dioxygenase large terminal subunit
VSLVALGNALGSEITDHPLARTVCGEDIVCYRLPNGTAVALKDRCPHRRYPLSLGRLDGETLVCGYHGFSFDCNGTCIAVPGQSRLPAHADVASYHLIEQGMWTWVWIGEEEPGARRPQPTPWLERSSDWTAVTGMAPIECRHSLLVDNLLDLSHETYLHGGYIGTPEVSNTPITTTVDREHSIVRVIKHMESVECPPFYEHTTGLSSPIDRWQDIEFFAPALYVLHVRIASAGSRPASNGNDDGAFHVKVLYGLTPSTTARTYDFWAVCRDFSVDDLEVNSYLDTMQNEIVVQDVDALNLLEARISSDPNPFEVVLGIDRGALTARRVIQALSGGFTDRPLPEEDTADFALAEK